MAQKLNEREQFEEWWPSVGQTIGKVAAWEAWKARALIDDPNALDCTECDGTGIYSPSLNPEYDVPCGECRGDRIAPWAEELMK